MMVIQHSEILRKFLMNIGYTLILEKNYINMHTKKEHIRYTKNLITETG